MPTPLGVEPRGSLNKTLRLKVTRTFGSTVLKKLIGWASTSFEKSLGQPALPHIIIALNATDLSIDPHQWDVKEATRKLLSDVEGSVEKIPALKTYVEKWRLNGRTIRTTKDLLECYYSSITVVRIPGKRTLYADRRASGQTAYGNCHQMQSVALYEAKSSHVV